jgi:hypothetical protein
MLRWLLRRRIAAFEREYDYEMGYARDLLRISPRALALFGSIVKVAQFHRDVPAEALYAAKLVATKEEDCGPCTQLAVTMAERAGVAATEIRAVLAGDQRAMGEATRLGFRFAEAVLAHDPAAEEFRAEIVRRWGELALVSLAFAVAATRVFPTVKYALGHGVACSRVAVAGSPVAVLRAA